MMMMNFNVNCNAERSYRITVNNEIFIQFLFPWRLAVTT